MVRAVVTLANGITAGRLALAGIFFTFMWQGRLMPAVAVFALAWGLDAVDGWLARYLNQVTPLGSLLDKITDRILIAGGVVALLALQAVPDLAVLLLTKDLASLPVMTIHAARREPIAAAGWWGKATTFLQGSAMVWMLLHWPAPSLVILLVAVFGGVAGTIHLYKVAYREVTRQLTPGLTSQ